MNKHMTTKPGYLTLFIGSTILSSLFQPGSAGATPSAHVWTPSPDIQANGTLHLTADMYVPSESDVTGKKPDTVSNLGAELGVWPIKDKLGVEFGLDNIQGYGPLDDYPLYFNFKVGTPENSLFEHSPAVGVGGYYFGTESNKTTQNVWYFKAGETLTLGGFSLGRVSAGWFWGDEDLLTDDDGDSDANGVMLTWERTVTEISDKLSLCVDYQGSDSSLGAIAPGITWKFADNVAMVVGYIIPNNDNLAETFTVQVDIDAQLWE